MNEKRSSREIRKSYHSLLQRWEWKQFTQYHIEKANGECWACEGADEDDLQVHHLVYRDILPWEYEDNEVRVLCRDCHESLHRVADLIWVATLRFQPHELEVILKRLNESKGGSFDGLCRGLSPAELVSEAVKTLVNTSQPTP